MKALQRYVAADEERQAIVALHVRALYLAASSKVICLPKPPLGSDGAVGYYGKRVRAFALVFREVGALLAQGQIARLGQETEVAGASRDRSASHVSQQIRADY